MNPSLHAKTEFREMRLRKLPRCIVTVVRWYIRHHLTIKVCIVAALFLMVSHWQYQSEIAEARLTNVALKKQLATLVAFEQLPDKTFIVRAKSMGELYSVFEQIEHAALVKRTEVMGAIEEGRK